MSAARHDPETDPEPDGEAEPEARYDGIADGYARYWGPVIAPWSERVLDALGPTLDPRALGSARRLLDIGAGTGTVALAAIGRWPDVRVTAIDASGEMLDRARSEAERRLGAADHARLDTRVALADRLPYDDATFDAAVSSFVLQLVPDRAAALREARRVLRPGAPLAIVLWLRHRGPADPPDRVFDEVLDEFGFDPPEPDPPGRDPASPRTAAEELRRAGFREVRAWRDAVVHRWTPRSYLAFLEGFAEDSLFDELVERERRALRRRLLERLGELAPDELRLELPIVYATGRAGG